MDGFKRGGRRVIVERQPGSIVQPQGPNALAVIIYSGTILFSDNENSSLVDALLVSIYR
jgi:hypothetical protein